MIPPGAAGGYDLRFVGVGADSPEDCPYEGGAGCAPQQAGSPEDCPHKGRPGYTVGNADRKQALEWGVWVIAYFDRFGVIDRLIIVTDYDFYRKYA